MAKFYKIEIQTNKEGQVIPAAIATYQNDDSEVAAREAESAYHMAVASMLISDKLNDFLCVVMTETGYIDPSLSRYYNFVKPEPEPKPESEFNTDNTEE